MILMNDDFKKARRRAVKGTSCFQVDESTNRVARSRLKESDKKTFAKELMEIEDVHGELDSDGLTILWMMLR